MSLTCDRDWRGLREVGRVVRLTLDVLERHAAAGVTTGELDHLALEIFEAHGARSAPALTYGFPGTVLISVNDEIVHGIPGMRTLRAGDVVKLDVTAEKDGYVADAARTLVLPGGTDEARRLAACAEAAFHAAAAVARAGTPVNEIGRRVEETVTAAGFTVVRTLEGHGVGRTIHEPPRVPNWFDRRQRDVLTEGLVITIEPLITSGRGRVAQDGDGWTIRTTDGRLAAHHEHTLVITRNDPVLLTAA
ncbi:MAG TPA: type I methionyl aminopeptidase [Vicinamibacterales bacterium]|nr:type I methionyl aminopeptidase [Vicinamibacterales bacterium]